MTSLGLWVSLVAASGIAIVGTPGSALAHPPQPLSPSPPAELCGLVVKVAEACPAVLDVEDPVSKDRFRIQIPDYARDGFPDLQWTYLGAKVCVNAPTASKNRSVPTVETPTPPEIRIVDSSHVRTFGVGAISFKTPGLVLPKAIKRVDPGYTSDAMRMAIRGNVTVDIVVLPNGQVGDTRMARSLDRCHGLDEAAIAAARQWRFEPASVNGAPVAVVLSLEMTFTMK